MTPMELSGRARNMQIAISDDSHWIDLIDFRPALVSRIRKLKITTLGQLRAMSPEFMITTFGRIKAVEIYRQFANAGFTLEPRPSDADLWQFGFLQASEIARPTAPGTALGGLRPWLGATVDTLAANGIGTLGELMAMEAEGSLPMLAGFTQSSIDRVQDFLRR